MSPRRACTGKVIWTLLKLACVYTSTNYTAFRIHRPPWPRFCPPKVNHIGGKTIYATNFIIWEPIWDHLKVDHITEKTYSVYLILWLPWDKANSHNIQYLSQDDKLPLYPGRKFKGKTVTISNICHKAISSLCIQAENLRAKKSQYPIFVTRR